MDSYGEAGDPAAKPHVVLLAPPAPGHMLPFIALGKALAQRGVKVTCLSSGVMSEKLRRELVEEVDVVDMTLGSVVEDPVPEPDNPRDLVPWLFKLTPDEMVERAVTLLRTLSPPPCLLISDAFLSWTALIATQLSIPRHFLITMSAGSLAFMFQVPLFTKQGLLPMDRPSAATNSDLNVPGVGTVAEGDVWEYFIKGHPLQSDAMIATVQNLTESSSSSATYLINSVEALEPQVFDALKEPISFTDQVAKVVSIGPLETAFASKEAADCDIASLELVESKKSSEGFSSEVMQWLDAQPSGSVVYVAFGSIFSLTEEQIRELAHALEACGQRFLWILRPPEAPQVRVSQQGPALQKQITALLPPGFEERTKGRGLLYSSWAPQPRILAHKAVGCFVSHCGWNSILEAIATSTPILACPCFVDQHMNATFVEKRFRIGRAMRDEQGKFYERGQIESMVRGIMMDGAEERRNVVHLNMLMREAVTSSSKSGSSSSNFHHYVADIFALDQQLHSRTACNGLHNNNVQGRVDHKLGLKVTS